VCAMVMSEVTRTHPPHVAGEREMLDAYLDYQRSTLLWKCQGLTDDQMRRRPAEPSTLSLLGLVRHMTEVENSWFGGFAGRRKAPRYFTEERPDDDFDALDEPSVAEVVSAYLAECEASRNAVAGRDLDETFVGRRGHPIALRWIYLHMIEEYARHNGHADLIREGIDGVVGE
jgi:uncharacterized damage-inducible protein DinB